MSSQVSSDLPWDDLEIDLGAIIAKSSLTNVSHCYHPPRLAPLSSTARDALFWLYTLTGLVILLINLITILLHLSSASPYLRNLSKYLINLTVSDTSLSLLSLYSTYHLLGTGQWDMPVDWSCPLSQYAQSLTVCVTSSTLSAIALERYTVTFYPLSSASRWLKRHGSLSLSIIWACGLAYAYLCTVHRQISQFIFQGNVYKQCVYLNEDAPRLKRLQVITFSLTYLIPLALIVVAYLAILDKLKHLNFVAVQYVSENGTRNASVHIRRNSPVENERTKLIETAETLKMILKLIGAFTFCWTPIKIFQFLQSYHLVSSCTEEAFNRMLYSYLACHWFAMANGFLNPIIYTLNTRQMGEQWRKMVQRVRDFLC